jgi:hypothetical protein
MQCTNLCTWAPEAIKRAIGYHRKTNSLHCSLCSESAAKQQQSNMQRQGTMSH